MGEKPAKEHYSNISDLEYLNIPKDNWNLEQETLNYLQKDVEGLLEAVLKFNDNIYSKYQLDITKHFLKLYQVWLLLLIPLIIFLII